MKKVLKIILGGLVFLTLPSLLFFAFFYFKYHENLPEGTSGNQADTLAYNMLNALNYEAYKNTDMIEWTFKNRRHYIWNKSKNTCEVLWKSYRVDLNLANPTKSTVFIHGFRNESDISHDLIKKALRYFNNDSFWLVAPYKVFDKGTERKLVKIANKDALLVTYSSGGTTPGDSYLWLLDDNDKPYAFKMWTSILPIDGLEASWDNWITTNTGAMLPTFHKFLFLGLEITHIKTSSN
ncbi:hypothetical protein KFZ70_12665 [Tamlana fucoidanivorans]|uniref:Uncharacterized protein n=1 Tax=Allotamlana fucoidanivorans TaxID=2583814 RepID=A0A5C4SDA5_9FLAO|nr:hypothetical protein [Tamlana fucoidanivorans]TNJ41543.1 hypothetical protein FGF67_15825 [Tamlana fucoidanivorans]